MEYTITKTKPPSCDFFHYVNIYVILTSCIYIPMMIFMITHPNADFAKFKHIIKNIYMIGVIFPYGLSFLYYIYKQTKN